MIRSIYLILCLLLASCAQVVPPEGGDKDVTPPRIVNSYPENFQTNFSGNEITLQFDEFVQLQNEQLQVVTSPPLGTMDYTLRGKTLRVSWNFFAEPNTTYQINFGEAIVDYNEGNPLDSNVFVFSTGSFLDSLTLSGVVTPAGSEKLEKGTLVMLYRFLYDSVPMKIRPWYLTRTDVAGNYKFTNLKEGVYKIVALQDANANYLYDDPEKEMIGFRKDSVVLVSDTVIPLQIFREEPAKQRLRSVEHVRQGQIRFVFAKAVDSLKINMDNLALSSDTLLEINSRGDTLNLWVPSATKADTFTILTSAAGIEQDTVLIKPWSAGKVKANVQEKLIISPVLDENKNARPGDSLQLRFREPVISKDTTKIFLTAGGDTLPYVMEVSPRPVRSITMNAKLELDSSYLLTLLPGAFTSVTGLTNDTMVLSFGVNEAAYYGNLLLKLKLPDASHPFILIFENQAGATLSKLVVTESREITFSNLAPGGYSFRLIYDTNGNGTWDTGNYLLGMQPEKVVKFPGAVTVRSNWDQDIEWDVTAVGTSPKRK